MTPLLLRYNALVCRVVASVSHVIGFAIIVEVCGQVGSEEKAFWYEMPAMSK